MVFRPKKKTDSQYNQSAWKGIPTSSNDTTPVPIVTENHEGEKLRTTRRQPTSYFDCTGKSYCWNRCPVVSPAGSPTGFEADADIVRAGARGLDVDVCESICASGIVMAGLFDARRISSLLSSSMTWRPEGELRTEQET